MSVICLVVPALGRELTQSPNSKLLNAHPTLLHSTLVPSFGLSSATVEATLLTGRPPSQHQVLFESDAPRTPLLAGSDPGTRVAGDLAAWLRSARDSDQPVTFGRWSDLAQAKDDSSFAAALTALEESVSAVLSEEPVALFLMGAPCWPAPRQVIELPNEALESAGWKLTRDARFCLLEPGSDAQQWQSENQDLVLTRPGVERVLTGRALELRHAPTERGVILMAEPGWSFAPIAGQPRLSNAPTAVLLGFGQAAADVRWPTSVHDWRVAPTMARAAGLTGLEFYDDPLPW